MFKNVPQVKTRCGDRNASETFAERSQFWDYLIKFFIIKKLLRQPVLARKLLFHLFWHWFITLSYKWQLHRKVAIQAYFFPMLQVKMERNVYQRFSFK